MRPCTRPTSSGKPEEAAALEDAIGWADVLVFDADLAVPTVNHIAEHARNNNKPLFMSIGSALAGTRTWLHSNVANAAVCVSGRLLVICTILATLKVPEAEIKRVPLVRGHRRSRQRVRHQRDLPTPEDQISRVQQRAGIARASRCSRQAHAPYKCFFATPEDVRYRMQQGNSAGVVDGALAGFIESYAQLARKWQAADDGSIVNDDTAQIFKANILDFVEHVSESEGATPGSVISFEEQASEQSQLAKLWRLTRIAFDMLPVFRYLLSLAALIIALWLFDLALDVLRYLGYNVDLPDKPWVRMLLRR